MIWLAKASGFQLAVKRQQARLPVDLVALQQHRIAVQHRAGAEGPRRTGFYRLRVVISTGPRRWGDVGICCLNVARQRFGYDLVITTGEGSWRRAIPRPFGKAI